MRPSDGDDGCKDPGDELVAQIIPLRRRAHQPGEPADVLGEPDGRERSPDRPRSGERSVWEQPTVELRRRGAEQRSPPADVQRPAPPRRAILAVLLPLGTVGVVVLVAFAVVALQGGSPPTAQVASELRPTPPSAAPVVPATGRSSASQHRSTSRAAAHRRAATHAPPAHDVVASAPPSVATSSTGPTSRARPVQAQSDASSSQRSAASSPQTAGVAASREFGFER